MHSALEETVCTLRLDYIYIYILYARLYSRVSSEKDDRSNLSEPILRQFCHRFEMYIVNSRTNLSKYVKKYRHQYRVNGLITEMSGAFGEKEQSVTEKLLLVSAS